MSKIIEDGGPAFPRSYSANGHNGMSLRDYFAGQAVAGIMAYPHIKQGTTNASMATVAWAIADAMIAARKGGDA